MKKLILIACIIISAITLNSCNDDSEKNYPYQARLTDAPGPYDSVNIDLIGVEVTGSNGSTVALNTTVGMYNLLDFSNGLNTIIATSTLHDARVNQIRLILGPNSTVVVDGVTYPLNTPSAEQSGLKLLVNQTLQEDIQNDILIDFDANVSIVQTGAGAYKLKPVLRTVVTAVSGIVQGSITPVGTMAVVSAMGNGVVYSSNVSDLGGFQILGLPAGLYTLTVIPALPLLPYTDVNVVVTAGATTAVGVVALHE